MDDAPYLAFEYLHRYFLASIPPVWFYVMNPRVEALDDIKHGKKNLKNPNGISLCHRLLKTNREWPSVGVAFSFGKCS